MGRWRSAQRPRLSVNGRPTRPSSATATMSERTHRTAGRPKLIADGEGRPAHPDPSLKQLLLRHELALLVLVVVTGALGGLWAYVWKDTSTASLRLNTLTQTAHHVRSDLFRQIREVTRARLMEDPKALDLYRRYSRRIDDHFNTLRRESATHPEDLAIQAMQRAYRVIQKDMNNIFTDPYVIDQVVRLKILDSSFEQRMVSDFESAFTTLDRLLGDQHAALDRTVRRWTRLSPLLLPLPICLAAGLVALSRRRLQRGFVRPMAEVIRGARTMSAGHLEHRVPEAGVHEVAELAAAMNEMAGELAKSRTALLERERQAALGRLVPVIAHNIRNPLASIRASAQLLDPADEAGEILEVKEAVIDTVDRLGRWVDALVSYLHPLRPGLTPGRLSPRLDAVLGLLAAALARKQLRLTHALADPEPEIPVDPNLMEQALHALISNAVDASPEGGSLRVLGAPGDGEYVLRIEDEGPGMPFRPEPNGLTPGPSTKRFGTGLGLPIAFKICQAHGFDLRFEPRPGGGTAVSIHIPLAQREATR